MAVGCHGRDNTRWPEDHRPQASEELGQQASGPTAVGLASPRSRPSLPYLDLLFYGDQVSQGVTLEFWQLLHVAPCPLATCLHSSRAPMPWQAARAEMADVTSKSLTWRGRVEITHPQLRSIMGLPEGVPCWHEVVVSRYMDPVITAPILAVSQVRILVNMAMPKHETSCVMQRRMHTLLSNHA